MTRLVRRFLPLLLGLLLAAPPAAGQDDYIRSPRLGITFISSYDHPASELRYQHALLLGAGWNRWPLYWNLVERAPGVYDWTGYDRLVSDDVRHGLGIDAILLGRPAFHQQGGSIAGLNNPVFSDGTDTLGAGKTPNPANPWASFVYQAVQRYKPGGLLAQARGWRADWGITVWEAWNEPDLPMFWSSGVAEYARLLKVAYLAAHSADPNARVLFGGLAYGNPDTDDWLAKVLSIFSGDPSRTTHNWYIDIVGVHNYSFPRRSGLVVARIRDNLRRYGLDRSIWLNESGVPVWDDYPGPTWTRSDPASRALRATQAQQAAFVVESTAYAWASGADVVFFHQLYDDCGNQPGGTDFPPHNGELCSATSICAGDAHGLYRNERGESCFSQHPYPGTPRPSAAAYYRLAEVFGNTPFQPLDDDLSDGSGRVIAFERPSTDERILVMWNRSLQPVTLEIEAAGSSAMLYSIDDQDWLITPTDGKYEIGLSPATRDDYPYLAPGEVSAIGGPPFILVEQMSDRPSDTSPSLPALTPAPLALTPGAITATQPAPPTTDPALDTTPPTTAMTPLPVISAPAFAVHWSGQDDSGIDRYLVWVRVNDADWQPWLETRDTQAVYTGAAGNTYQFAVWAVDLAGNWSLNTELTPQATTAVQ